MPKGLRTSYVITEHNKDIIYKYAKEHRDVTIVQFMEALNLSKGQVTHAVKYLVHHRHLTKVVRRVFAGKWAYFNSTVFEFHKRDKPPVRNTKDPAILDLPPEAKAVATVYKLLDREPTAKYVRKKHRIQVNMQSGMQGFGDWA